MSKFLNLAHKSGSQLNNLLRMSGPGLTNIYNARRPLSTSSDSPISFTKIRESQEVDVIGLSQKLKTQHPSGIKIDLTKPQVLRVSKEETKMADEDASGQIIVTTLEDDVIVKYGNKGVAASKEKYPKDLLQNVFVISRNSFGVLDIQDEVPFSINTKNPERALALAACQLSRVPTYQESMKSYYFKTLCELPKDAAKLLTIDLQIELFHNRSRESFYKEMTSTLYYSSEHNRSSAHLVDFETLRANEDNSADMHYTSGTRIFHIVTNKRTASVTLNFCGTAENPDERKDCEVNIDFPPNSLSILSFPPNTHRKFRGDFTCIEIHPKEGEKLIEASRYAESRQDYLKKATVFSSTTNNQEKWSSSAPESDINKQKPSSRSL